MLIYVAVSHLNSKKSIELLENSGFDIRYNKNNSTIPPEQLKNLINDADGVIAGVEQYTQEVLLNAHNLKCISRVGESSNNINQEIAKQQGIVVRTIGSDVVNKRYAEMIFAAIMSSSFNIPNYPNCKTISIGGSSVMIVGYNERSIELAKMLKNVGANAHIYDSEADVPFEYFYSLRKGVMDADFIVFTSKIKEKMLDKETITSIKQGSLLFDLWGKGLDIADLESLLKSKKISGYWSAEAVKTTTKYANMHCTPMHNAITRQYLDKIEEIAVLQLLETLSR